MFCFNYSFLKDFETSNDSLKCDNRKNFNKENSTDVLAHNCSSHEDSGDDNGRNYNNILVNRAKRRLDLDFHKKHLKKASNRCDTMSNLENDSHDDDSQAEDNKKNKNNLKKSKKNSLKSMKKFSKEKFELNSKSSNSEESSCDIVHHSITETKKKKVKSLENHSNHQNGDDKPPVQAKTYKSQKSRLAEFVLNDNKVRKSNDSKNKHSNDCQQSKMNKIREHLHHKFEKNSGDIDSCNFDAEHHRHKSKQYDVNNGQTKNSKQKNPKLHKSNSDNVISIHKKNLDVFLKKKLVKSSSSSSSKHSSYSSKSANNANCDSSSKMIEMKTIESSNSQSPSSPKKFRVIETESMVLEKKRKLATEMAKLSNKLKRKRKHERNEDDSN